MTRAVLPIAGLALSACFGLQGPRNDTSIDLPVECGFELLNRTRESFVRLEAVPMLDLGGELRPAERRRVQTSCAPACFVIRGWRGGRTEPSDPAGFSTVTVRPGRLTWTRAELREPDPFGSTIGLIQAADRAGCV